MCDKYVNIHKYIILQHTHIKYICMNVKIAKSHLYLTYVSCVYIYIVCVYTMHMCIYIYIENYVYMCICIYIYIYVKCICYGFCKRL